ncbi:MAG: SDR family oxidoreductase, partial [Nocardioides sp.]
MTILVVGGNGQLGAACCAELVAREIPVRATVRVRERARHLPSAVEVVELDLTEGPARRTAALAGVDTVIFSANATAPRRGDSANAFEEAGLALIDEAVAAGVRRIVLPSVPVTDLDDRVPLARDRREAERRLAAAPIESCVLRFPPFMDVWLALVGSSLPLRGESFATVGRPSPF